MKTFRFVFSLVITLTIGISLNTKIGQIPPLGKFLSPFHGFWQNAENEAIDLAENIKLDGIEDPIKIHFDELLIPHIYANNEQDLFFAQGYITAYHRLWQMEFQLLSAEGRISELLGTQALQYDRGQRRIGLKFGAKKSEEQFKKRGARNLYAS